jgi:hypothetical protein
MLRQLAYHVFGLTMFLVAGVIFAFLFIVVTGTDVGPETMFILQLTAFVLAITVVLVLAVLYFTQEEVELDIK